MCIWVTQDLFSLEPAAFGCKTCSTIRDVLSPCIISVRGRTQNTDADADRRWMGGKRFGHGEAGHLTELKELEADCHSRHVWVTEPRKTMHTVD